MRTPKLVVGAALISLLLPLTGTPAHAATRVKQDRTGDAPARIDITRATYTYADGRVKVRARIPDLGRYGTAALSISRFEIFEAGYVVRIVKRVGQPARVALFYFDHFDLHRRDCDQVSGNWNDSSIRLAVSTSCLKRHARPRVFVQFGISRAGNSDFAPAVRSLPRD